jgi:hypothetical protein
MAYRAESYGTGGAGMDPAAWVRKGIGDGGYRVRGSAPDRVVQRTRFWRYRGLGKLIKMPTETIADWVSILFRLSRHRLSRIVDSAGSSETIHRVISHTPETTNEVGHENRAAHAHARPRFPLFVPSEELPQTCPLASFRASPPALLLPN